MYLCILLGFKYNLFSTKAPKAINVVSLSQVGHDVLCKTSCCVVIHDDGNFDVEAKVLSIVLQASC
jgi:hypothetical protein